MPATSKTVKYTIFGRIDNRMWASRLYVSPVETGLKMHPWDISSNISWLLKHTIACQTVSAQWCKFSGSLKYAGRSSSENRSFPAIWRGLTCITAAEILATYLSEKFLIYSTRSMVWEHAVIGEVIHRWLAHLKAFKFASKMPPGSNLCPPSYDLTSSAWSGNWISVSRPKGR